MIYFFCIALLFLPNWIVFDSTFKLSKIFITIRYLLSFFDVFFYFCFRFAVGVLENVAVFFQYRFSLGFVRVKKVVLAIIAWQDKAWLALVLGFMGDILSLGVPAKKLFLSPIFIDIRQFLQILNNELALIDLVSHLIIGISCAI